MSGGRGLRSVVTVHSVRKQRDEYCSARFLLFSFQFFHSKPLALSAAHIWGEYSQLTQPKQKLLTRQVQRFLSSAIVGPAKLMSDTKLSSCPHRLLCVKNNTFLNLIQRSLKRM